MTLSDLQIQGQRALVRVDFNVPLDSAHHITDDTRIRRAIPTIQALLDGGASVVLMSHLGRPKGPDAGLSLKHLVRRISQLLGTDVAFAPDCVGDAALDVTQQLKPGEVALLENLRFHPEEKAGDEFFAGQLAENGDVYVNDAFGTAHRAHASTAVIAKFFPEDKAFGLLMHNEIEALNKVLATPAKPLLAIIGGAKVSSKLTILENLVDRVDRLIVGGGMAYTFVKAQGGAIGTSLVEDDMPSGSSRKHRRPAPNSCCLKTRCARTTSLQKPTPPFIPPMRFPTTGWAWTLGPKHGRPSSKPCWKAAPSSGMDPWGFLRWTPLPVAPTTWPRLWPKSPQSTTPSR